MSAKAAVEIRDVIRVWIEMRPPKKGELTWAVPIEATPEQALEYVTVGRDVWSSGEAGFGFYATCDEVELNYWSEAGMRYIVVHVDYVRSEPDLSNILPHVKLL
jgi:hypothetical protein